MAYYLSKNRNKTITIGTPKEIALLFWLAEQKGFLHEENVKVKFVPVPYSRKAMEMLIDGKLDMAVLVETNVAYLGYLKPKVPLKCIASIERRSSDNIIMRHDMKEPSSAEHLKDKTIGFMPRTSSHGFLMHFMKAHNINKQDIKLKEITPQAMPNAIIRGEVDAISIWQPFVHNTLVAMEELGMHATCFDNTKIYASHVVLATTKPYMVKNNHQIESLLKALKRAEHCHAQHPDDIHAILDQKLQIRGKNHEEIWEKFEPNLRRLDNDYMNNITTLSEWIRSEDTQYEGKELPDYTDLIDNSLLDKITEIK